MTSSSDAASRLWADRSYLLGSQYKTDTNLSDRQSIYAYQEPRIDLAAVVLDLAGLDGTESVADVGCGNGVYLAELARRRHRGPVVGLDLSAGMLTAARNRAHAAGASAVGLARGDAAAIPLPDGACDVALAPHMLYHLPDPAAGVRELRRIVRRADPVRPGGRAIVVLNGEDHLRELRDLVDDALDGLGWPTAASYERVSLDEGEELLSASFASVTRHDFHAWLEVPDPEPVIDYVRSMRVIQDSPAPQSAPVPESVVAAATERITATPDGLFRIRTHTGCLICT